MVMAMKNKIIFFSFFYLVFASCQKDSVPVSVVEGDKSVVCQIAVMGVEDTKSYVVTKDTLIQEDHPFRMDAWLEEKNRDRRSDLWPQLDENPHYIKDAIMTYRDGSWQSSPDTVFWTNQIQTNFWAQYPATLPGRGELTWPATPKSITDEQEKTPSFTYDMSAYSEGEAAEVTPDLLVAYSREMYYEKTSTTPASGGKLSFTFAHVLSAIKFLPKKTIDPYYIDSVQISGICTQGLCKLVGLSDNSVSATWFVDTIDTCSSFCQALRKGTPFREETDMSYIFLIPQGLTSKATLSAIISDGTTSILKKVSLEGATWKPGYIYKYTLNYDPDKNSFTATVCEDGYTTYLGIWK